MADASEDVVMTTGTDVLENFGPTDLFNIIKKFKFETVLTQYKPIFGPDNTIDLRRSPTCTNLTADITTSSQIQFLQELIAKGKRVRELTIETGQGAAGQCKFLYSKLGKPAPTKCWLCGFELDIPGDRRSSVECEHIIPAAAALLFYGIIDESSDVTPKGAAGGHVEDPGDVEFFSLNYDLAHSECNSPKKDDLLFIKLFDSNYKTIKPEINEVVVNKFIDSLLLPVAGRNSLVYDLLEKTGQLGDIPTWKQTRKTEIISRMQPLLDSMSRGPAINLLSGTAKLITNIDFIFAKYFQEGGICFPYYFLNKDGSGSWQRVQVKSKKDYYNFIDLADTKMTDATRGKGGNRKTFRRKHNGILVRIKKLSIRKSTVRRNVAASNSDRKIRASSRKRS
jgi:hypothetical protein